MEPATADFRQAVTPSAVARYISVERCHQFYQYEFDSDARSGARNRKNWTEAFEPLRLLLAADGEEFEQEVESQLAANSQKLVDYSLSEQTDVDSEHSVSPDEGSQIDRAQKQWTRQVQEELQDQIQEVVRDSPGAPPTILAEAPLGGTIGAWPVYGRADLCVLWPEQDHLRIRVLEEKSANEEQTYHQIQVSIYTLLLRQYLEEQGFDPSTFTIEGGVIVHGTNCSTLTPAELPRFDLETREMDVRKILSAGGEFDELAQLKGEKAPHELTGKCMSCSFREVCYTDAIESNDIKLLGLSVEEQNAFRRHGVDDLQDLASLAYPNDSRPYEYSTIEPIPNSGYDSLISNPIVGNGLHGYIQQAQSLLSRIHPSHPHAHDSDEPNWIAGSGRPELPNDDPPEAFGEPAVQRKSLIRIYLHTSYDHRRDCLAGIGGYITATRYSEAGNSPITFAELYDEVPERGNTDAIEKDLLSGSINRIIEAVSEISSEMSESRLPVHVYTYSEHEWEELQRGLKRHSGVPEVAALRELVDLREGIQAHSSDQSMVSVVEREAASHIAPTSPTTGLIAMIEEFDPYHDKFLYSRWTYTRESGTEVNLREAFNYRFFNNMVPYKGHGEDIELLTDEYDGFYPSRVRKGSTFPLEYIWGCLGTFTEEYVSDYTEMQYESIDRYLWLDNRVQQDRIQEEDVKALMERLAHCVAHVEQGLLSNASLSKPDMPAADLRETDTGAKSLARAAIEFLDLEYSTQRKDKLETMGLSLKQRVRKGESVPLVVREVEEDPETGSLRIDGELLFDTLFPQASDAIAHSCRLKGGQESTSGSWMVANEITNQGELVRKDTPETIERGVPVTVERLDVTGREIELEASPYPKLGKDAYQVPHRRWNNGNDSEQASTDYETTIGEGTLLVLDPRTDSLPARRTRTILENSELNTLSTLFEQVLDGSITEPTTDIFDSDAVDEFIEWYGAENEFPPNEKQQQFIRGTTAQISLLQGPPGTGKTSGALAPAIVSRAYAFAANGEDFTGAMAGPSNKAVDEALSDAADILGLYEQTADDLLDSVEIIRLTSGEPDDPHPHVTYVDYHDENEAFLDLINHIYDRGHTHSDPTGEGAQQTLESLSEGGYGGDDSQQKIIFTTSTRLSGLLNNLDGSMHGEESLDAGDWAEAGFTFLDMLSIDEGSMLQLPQLLQCGAFLNPNGQLLVAGDQRQLPPVRSYEWSDERRKSIEQYVPYLSALDYCRHLRGDSVDEIPATANTKRCAATIPLTQLEVTYRCHETVADFLQDTVYAADGISYQSGETQTIPTQQAGTAGLEAVLSEAPLSVVVHSDTESQTSNEVEAEMIEQILSSVVGIDTAGIVTPHNAQRGLLESTLSSQGPIDPDIDTVERFQGGERELMLLSTTVSSPDFLETESDFILSPNRLNVAMSRMEQKLIILVPESIFELIPQSPDEYDDARLWKSLYKRVEQLPAGSDWEGQLSDFVPAIPQTQAETNISVYNIY